MLKNKCLLASHAVSEYLILLPCLESSRCGYTVTLLLRSIDYPHVVFLSMTSLFPTLFPFLSAGAGYLYVLARNTQFVFL